ncbi:MAG TPA: hypothetical protein DCS93_02910 [Microscillaceae bacterium]|nr:hypothetical protein [Microscillaceae bacterium]
MRRPLYFLLFMSLLATSGVWAQTAEEYFDQGNIKLNQGDYTGAVENYDKAIAQQSRVPAFYANRAK